MSRNVLVAVVAMLVFAVVAGAVYLELAASAGARDSVWETSQSVSAGDLLTADNVHRQTIPHAGDNLSFFSGDLRSGTARASHDLASGTILFAADVSTQDLALVNLSLRTPPALQHGQTIDVYAQVGSTTVMVGRRLTVDQVSGTNCAVLVPASDEPWWITLQASNVALFAAKSSGVGVPQLRAQTMQDAIAALTGGSSTGPPLTLPASPSPSPSKKP